MIRPVLAQVRHLWELLLIAAMFSAGSLSPAFAQSDNTVLLDRAMGVANTIREEQLVLRAPDLTTLLASETSPEKVRELRQLNMNILLGHANDPEQKILMAYIGEAQALDQTADIKISRMIDVAARAIDENSISDESLEKITRYNTDPDWFVSSKSYVIEGILAFRFGETNQALDVTREAVRLIPQTYDDRASEANYEALDILMSAHARLGHDTSALSAMEDLVKMARTQDRSIDGYAILSNLVYLTHDLRAYEEGYEISRIMLRLSQTMDANSRGISHLWVGLSLNKLARFDEAVEHFEKATAMISESGWHLSAEIHKATALAGAGRIDDAKAQLEAVRLALDTQPRKREGAELEALHTQALLALQENRLWDGYALLRAMAHAEMREMTDLNSAKVQDLLANLEYEQTLESERLAFLQKENELNAQLVMRQRYVLGLLACLAVLLAGWTLFLRKTNHAISESRDKARAASAAKSEFLAVMSHELRTPLNGIIGMSDILSRTSTSPLVASKSNLILKSGRDLMSMVNQVLDMSQLEKGEFNLLKQPGRIRQMCDDLDELWRPVATSKRLTFTIHITADVPEFIMMDADRVRQCVDQLISNALKFTSEGRVHLQIQPSDARADMKTPNIEFIVIDTGQGIAAEKQTDLFKPFTQADGSLVRKHGGMGLGLGISKKLADAMGGTLQFHTSQGRGSEFVLRLPLEVPDKPGVRQRAASWPKTLSAAATAEHAPKWPNLSGIRVLIAEDIPVNRDILDVYLRPTKCQTVATENGIEAVQAASEQRFDIIILDIRMPEMDGQEAARLIRQDKGLNAATPIIALTADASKENQTACFEAGMNIFLTKPVVAHELYNVIEMLLSKDKATRKLSA